MNQDDLTAYLNDHLAGSVAALELLAHLIEAADEPADQALFADLKADIEADQEVLRGLLADMGGTESTVKKASAWLMEKAGLLKVKASGTGAADLGRFQALEGLMLGISGKLALWRALQESLGSIAAADLPDLIRRAQEQRDKVETRRLEVARVLFRR